MEGAKEAMFYAPLEEGAVKCMLCRRGCVIPDGGRGFCRVRKNVGGKLYSLNYGRAIGMAVDPIEKKPFYHFWPGSQAFSFATVGCNFRCLHCQNWDISQASPEDFPTPYTPPEELVREAERLGTRIIAYTYTEPTIFYEYARDTGVLAREKGMLNVFVTNGYTGKEAIDDAAKSFLDAARIDLKGGEEHYLKIAGGVVLDRVLDTIRDYYRTGMHVEIITLVIPGDNDTREFVARMAGFLRTELSDEVPWHFTRFYPAYKMTDVPPTSVETLEKMHDWAKEEGMKYVYIGNVPGHEYNNTYCPKCGEKVIERDGFTVTGVALSGSPGKYKCPSCGTRIPIVGEAKPTSLSRPELF